jgi:hypothetical protein
MAKKTMISRLNDAKAVISLLFAIGAVFVWLETRIVKVEIESMENNITLLLLPYGGSVDKAPPEVIATFNVWIKELGRKREG